MCVRSLTHIYEVKVAGMDTIEKCLMYYGLEHAFEVSPVIGVGRPGYEFKSDVLMKQQYANQSYVCKEFPKVDC